MGWGHNRDLIGQVPKGICFFIGGSAICTRKRTFYAICPILDHFSAMLGKHPLKRKEERTVKEIYSAEGYRIVSEVDHCPFWEKDTVPGYGSGAKDCFFCRYADFRKERYMTRMQGQFAKKPLYSICHHEKNRKQREKSVF